MALDQVMGIRDLVFLNDDVGSSFAFEFQPSSSVYVLQVIAKAIVSRKWTRMFHISILSCYLKHIIFGMQVLIENYLFQGNARSPSPSFGGKPSQGSKSNSIDASDSVWLVTKSTMTRCICLRRMQMAVLWRISDNVIKGSVQLKSGEL